MILIANKIESNEYVYIQDIEDSLSVSDTMKIESRLISELRVNVHICYLQKNIRAIRVYKETGKFETVTLRMFDTRVGRMFHLLGTREVYPIYKIGDVAIETKDGVIVSYGLKKELELE